MSVTAAEAAEKAVGWAEAAELALKQVDTYRGQAKQLEGMREMLDASYYRGLADDFEMYRERAVGMATMWAHVTDALRTAESQVQP
ncbi:hypothetical protein ACF08W_28775 [Streptomyces sp. NPDC015144]|uniref:hypothetical protein n=1 Tax=Streptomyces sp. NPDC015144 TaxID=3364944 RepID=UPI0036FF0BB7